MRDVIGRMMDHLISPDVAGTMRVIHSFIHFGKFAKIGSFLTGGGLPSHVLLQAATLTGACQ